MKKINLLDLGQTKYMDALAIQEKIHALRVDKKIADTLILTQHHPVITLGSTGSMDNLLLNQDMLMKKGVEFYEVGRGGDVTFHGPGQLVGYPILHLRENGLGVRDYLDKILDLFMTMLKEAHHLEAHKEYGSYTGAWIENRKITAIGIQVRHQVSLHGFAYNITTDLSYFQDIHPCGLLDRSATSLEMELGRPVDLDEEIKRTVDYFSRTFQLEMNPVTLGELLNEEE